jgi:uncharacterized membrane protein
MVAVTVKQTVDQMQVTRSAGTSADRQFGYFQETHPQELFRECSHYCELVSTPEQIPQVLASLDGMWAAIASTGTWLR